jgi:hypothetical protein
MTTCPTCAQRNHPEVDRCHRCGRPMGEASIAGRASKRFSTVVKSSALVTVLAVGLTLATSAERHTGLPQADCQLAAQAIATTYDALGDQSAARTVSVEKLTEAAVIWAELEAKHFPNKFSFSLPNGEHAWLEALLADTNEVGDLLARGEIAAAEIAERELVRKLKLYPQVCS